MGKTTMEVPCKGCKFREINCHSKCESDLEYMKILDECCGPKMFWFDKENNENKRRNKHE